MQLTRCHFLTEIDLKLVACHHSERRGPPKTKYGYIEVINDNHIVNKLFTEVEYTWQLHSLFFTFAL